MVIRVNVSARQLTEPGLIATVDGRARARAGSRPERLCLEVTESVVLEDGDRCVAALQALRDIGVGVALDDFGTGYSSLSYLRRLPVDSLKIDRSFVRGLGSEADDDSIVTSVIDLARSLGVSVVAEGVETEEQLAGLRARGCDTMQGFLFARPGPAAAVADAGRRGRPPGQPPRPENDEGAPEGAFAKPGAARFRGAMSTRSPPGSARAARSSRCSRTPPPCRRAGRAPCCGRPRSARSRARRR